MAIIQPPRRAKTIGRDDKGNITSIEFSEKLDLAYQSGSIGKTLSYAINEVSSSIAFYFNGLEDAFSINDLNAPTKNYVDWTGSYIRDVPLKNQAWQSKREVTDLLKQSAATVDEKLGGGGKYIEKFANLVNRKYKRTDSVIHLLVPDSIQFSSGAGWQDVNFDLNALGLFTDVVSNDQTRAASILQREAAELLDVLGEGGRISDAMMKSIKNPYTQQAFQGMNRRTFQLNWQFAPKSQAELETIDEMIAMFRFHMHPSISNLSGTGSNYLNAPSQIDLEWYFKDPESKEWVENAWLPKISTCVIESVSTDYTPNGQFSFFKDAGAPTQINFSIQIKEVFPLTRADVARGF